MLFNKELNNIKLISDNLKFTEFFIVTLQLDLITLIKSAKTKLFKIIKIFLHILILKRKRKNYNFNFKKSLIKILQTTLLTMFINKNLKIL